MSTRHLQFAPYDEARKVANIVIDGRPNESTVLTLSHWPGIEQPRGLGADLSAEMAFRYLDTPVEHAPATVVTNNHFDQDGLVGVHALVAPEHSLAQRNRLIDIAAAGDFGRYTFRESARASMAIWAYAQPDRSPLGSQIDGPYEQVCALLYETVLPLLMPMVEDPMRFRDLWHDEDRGLTASEKAIADGDVSIEELTELDLAVVTIGSDGLVGGHRFASDVADMIHPFAVNNATSCCRVLIIRGHEYLYIDRYETWVQFQSRALPQRVDLSPLRDQLLAAETGLCTWTASKPSTLTPYLRSTSDSSIANASVRQAVIHHLRSAPGAWDPFTPR